MHYISKREVFVCEVVALLDYILNDSRLIHACTLATGVYVLLVSVVKTRVQTRTRVRTRVRLEFGGLGLGLDSSIFKWTRTRLESQSQMTRTRLESFNGWTRYNTAVRPGLHISHHLNFVRNTLKHVRRQPQKLNCRIKGPGRNS